jgi:hypothetical protein
VGSSKLVVVDSEGRGVGVGVVGSVWRVLRVVEWEGWRLVALWWVGYLVVLMLGGNPHTFDPRKDISGKDFVNKCFETGVDDTIQWGCFRKQSNIMSTDLETKLQAWINDGNEGWVENPPS